MTIKVLVVIGYFYNSFYKVCLILTTVISRTLFKKDNFRVIDK